MHHQRGIEVIEGDARCITPVIEGDQADARCITLVALNRSG